MEEVGNLRAKLGGYFRENYMYVPVKLSYSLYGPANFEIPCMALCSIFNAPYDTTVHSVRFLS